MIFSEVTSLGWAIIVGSIFIGIVVGLLLSKHKKDKKIQKVIKDPHILAEKLKAHGTIYDMGKELDIEVGKDSEGKDAVMIKEKESKKAQKTQKKVAEDKTQTKKRVKKKKGGRK